MPFYGLYWPGPGISSLVNSVCRPDNEISLDDGLIFGSYSPGPNYDMLLEYLNLGDNVNDGADYRTIVSTGLY